MKELVILYPGYYGYASMRYLTIRTFNICLLFYGMSLISPPSLAASPYCPAPAGVVLQVLGSGGPIADDGRASTAYLVWVDGQARVLIDAGGGTFLRFGEAGAAFADLDFVGLSHFHTDHSADFAALLKSGNFSNRERDLAVAGPAGADPFPGLKAWLEAMLGREKGAYGYLGSWLDGKGPTASLSPYEAQGGNPVKVFSNERLTVEALQVPHGIVPALAFRVSVGEAVLVFASDQNGSDPAFVEFAKGASLLVMHLVVPEGVRGVGRRLHAPPSLIGEIAAEAEVGKLVLSHFMARSLRDLDGNVALVRESYDGDIVLAEDLACVAP
ncbi:MAG: MBL fold metallo-hydrolase [Gammaproteobacteria bacterium]|nr:MBL fold metallo-hydrolase [Gammaproteobacteria bacterium]